MTARARPQCLPILPAIISLAICACPNALQADLVVNELDKLEAPDGQHLDFFGRCVHFSDDLSWPAFLRVPSSE